MELGDAKSEPNIESIIQELLQQNTQLRFDLAVLRAAIKDVNSINTNSNGDMIVSQSLDDLSPEVVEMLSKFDFK